MPREEMRVDVLAIGAHPDDVEIGAGGTILRLVDQGWRVGILDLSRGELSSRGRPEEREVEAAAAAKALGVAVRRNADLPDGGLANTPEHRAPIIEAIRELEPRVLLSHMTPDRHPDHEVAHTLVRDANFFSGLTSIATEAEPRRAESMLFYRPYYEDATPPQFVMDISQYFEAKLEVLRLYRSQFHNPDYEGAETMISGEAFWEGIGTRAAYWGHRINVAYGEALYGETPVALESLPGLKGAS